MTFGNLVSVDALMLCSGTGTWHICQTISSTEKEIKSGKNEISKITIFNGSGIKF